MANMGIMSRLILRNSSQASLPRWLSTAAAAAPPRPRSRNTLFYKVVGAASKSSTLDTINEWVAGGRIVKKADIINLNSYFRSRKNYQAALQLYDWMDISNLEMTDADQAIRIDLLGRAEGSDSAEKYFNSLPEKTKKTYGALISCYCREKALDKAVETFEKLKESNWASTLDYNNMISLYYKLEKSENVISLVEEMEEKNIPLNIYTYNILINTYASPKSLDAVEKIVEKMESGDVKPDWFTYGNLATIFFNAGMHEKAVAFLESMEKIELQKNDAIDACRTRLRLYSMMNDLSGVIRAWDDLKSAEQKPSNTSYLFVLLALSKTGNQENLEEIFKEWEEVCTLYDYRLPNVLLEYYLSRDMIEEATSLYKRLEDGFNEREPAPNLRTLDLFTSICLKNSEIDLAMEYLEKGLEKAKSRDSKWYPGNETIEAFISYFKETGDVERRGKFIESVKHKRLQSEPLLAFIKATEEGS